MNKLVVNTFTDGMNKDIDKALMSNKTYLDAQNFRLITTEGNSTGALETIKGNKLISTDLILAGQFIIGSCEIRDKIILFTTSNELIDPTAGRSMIYSFSINLEGEVGTAPVVLYDDSLNSDNTFLLFSTAHPIKAVSRYETPNVQKVYWTDGYNNVRYINVASPLTLDGTPYTNDGDYVSVKMLEFLPEFKPVKPVLLDIVNGNLMSGVVQYAYQLYRLNGSETAISPVSGTIHIVSDGDFRGTTLNYMGDKESVRTSKGCKLSIYNANEGYNRLRLIRIHYSNFGSVPVISIANEVEIPATASTIKVIDSGDTIGEMTLDEFTITSTELFKCQDLAVKDNRLFAANIEKTEFTVDDWDARVVRFKDDAGTVTALVYDGETPTVIYQPATDDFIGWAAAGWDANVLPETHDMIQRFNDPTTDGLAAYDYRYLKNGGTLGAEGPNIRIDFETELFYLDVSNNATTFYASNPSSSTDLSYKNYASPWKGDKLSWQRDEVYRLFIVFGNDRGQVAPPKWMCDLRMPSLHDADFTNASGVSCKPSLMSKAESGTGYLYGHRLYPRVFLKTFPDNATWAQIYRVKRDSRSNRSIITQALVVPSYLIGSSHYTPHPLNIANLTTKEIIKLVSPEININKNITSGATDYIEYVTNYATSFSLTSNDSPFRGFVAKLSQNTRVPFTVNTKANVVEAFMITPATSTTEIKYCNSIPYGNYQPNTYTKGCTGLLTSYDNGSWAGEGVKMVVANYKANVYGSQYGGHTYEDRSLNISIPCSDVIPASSINTWIDVNGGDTFINFFDVADLLYDLASVATFPDDSPISFVESTYVPLESSINSDLRHDRTQQHFAAAFGDNWFMKQEYAGEHEDVHGRKLTQLEDLYSYNTVYSQETSVQYAISEVIDGSTETTFDCMIKASNIKFNGEDSESWAKFGINEFIEVDPQYGPVNGLRLFRNGLYYWQDKAFGALSVNERSVITDGNSAQLVLGTGGILDRFDYISNRVGCKDLFSIVDSLGGLYWFDRLSNTIYRYTDALLNLSKTKYIQSFMSNELNSQFKALAHADIYNDEILFTFFKQNETNGFTISYNEPIGAFISFYGFVPTIYIPYQHRYLTTTNEHYCGNDFKLNHLFLHDSDVWDRCYFYALTSTDNTKYVDSTLEILFNPEYDYTKVFDNLFYTSNVYSDYTDIFAETFHSVQCYNDFQNTGEITLVPKTNIERRERGWTLVVPRNIVNTNISSNPNIFADVDATQLFKERMRDKYLIAYLTYHNGNAYDRFVVSNMGLKYRISYR